MVSDIVTRLREIAEPGKWQSVGKWDATANEAADEIERWRNIAKMFYDRHENRRSCSLLASCKECDAYEKAVRGE